jgi:hypothetical protein
VLFYIIQQSILCINNLFSLRIVSLKEQLMLRITVLPTISLVVLHKFIRRLSSVDIRVIEVSTRPRNCVYQIWNWIINKILVPKCSWPFVSQNFRILKFITLRTEKSEKFIRWALITRYSLYAESFIIINLWATACFICTRAAITHICKLMIVEIDISHHTYFPAVKYI